MNNHYGTHVSTLLADFAITTPPTKDDIRATFDAIEAVIQVFFSYGLIGMTCKNQALDRLNLIYEAHHENIHV